MTLDPQNPRAAADERHVPARAILSVIGLRAEPENGGTRRGTGVQSGHGQCDC